MKQFFGAKSRSSLAAVLVVSLALHVVAIVIFGTIKFVAEVMREETVFEAVPVVPPPQKEPEYTVNLQQRNRDTPPPRPPAIVVNNPSELDIPALDIDVNVDSTSVYGRGGGGFGGGLAGVREMVLHIGLFGSQTAISDSLMGRLYDTKMNEKGKALPYSTSEYFRVLNEFVKNWDESVLKEFYQADVELYARQLFIPLVRADAAPEAFGAEDEIKPIYWAAHYKGEVVSPISGRIRFAGQGDNVLVVRFDRRVVLDASLGNPLAAFSSLQRDPIGKTPDPNNRPMVAGKWIEVRRGVSYSMEILLGEYGGLFSCYLLVEVDGENYQEQSDGTNPRLPVFQTAPAKLPKYVEGKDAPEIRKKPYPFGLR
jgi:hypothetical protein